MAVLPLNVALAILIALSQFGQSHQRIDLLMLKADQKLYATMYLVKDVDVFSILDEELVETGFVNVDPSVRYVYQFGESGTGPLIDLSKVIRNFDNLDLSRAKDLTLECYLGAEKIVFRFGRDGDRIVLTDIDAKEDFIIDGV